MHRLLVPPSELTPPLLLVRGDKLVYLRDVLRLKPGATLEVFDGEGRAFAATLRGYLDEGAELSLGEESSRPFAGVQVTLWQGLPKGDKLELVVQKAVELGGKAVRPVACERSIVKLDARKAGERIERWQKIADEAARQCRRADSMRIEPLLSLADALRLPPQENERRLVLDEEERSQPLRTALGTAESHHVLLIGPEGGLSRAEIEQAKAAGFVPVSLGPRILRTETAGIAVLAVLQHVLGDFG